MPLNAATVSTALQTSIESPTQAASLPAGIPLRAAYPLKEARVLLGDPSSATIYRWEAQGIIRLVRVGGRTLVPYAEIIRLAGGEVA